MKKLLIILTFLNLSLFTNCTKEKLIDNPNYAIGTISEYVPGWSHGPSSVRFDYVINEQTLYFAYSDGYNGWKVPVQAGYKTGDQFMVMYNMNNVNIARMLFDYPVKDSSDYKRYIQEFKTNPPQ